ncbi:MAG: TonB-dependent receptor [Bacteroidales bacterium]|nr:TonB-dependent receptor [Bacteroidales bacterium]
MKRIILLILSLLPVISLFSQDIVGTWNGTLSVQGYNLRLVFNITQDSIGYKATMDSPDQGAKGLAVSSVTFEDNKIKMEIDAVKAEYSGEVKENTIKGNFKQMGYAIPLDLTRAVSGQSGGSTNGFLRGRLLDSQTKEPLLFANVALIKDQDSSLVTGGATDEDGRFKLENLGDGIYRLQISNIGYHPYISHAIELKKGDNRQDLGTFYMNSSSTQLAEVVIEATRPVLEQQAGKLVFNVSESTTSVGDNALETLKKFPGVTVDNDDNISLNGKSGVLVMVDDRPTRLSGVQLANLLKSMPSESINKIEAIDNPSAKYDAEGVSGILNIKTKRTRTMGYSGTVFAGSRYNNEFQNNGGFNLNFRNNKFTAFANFNIFENRGKSGNFGRIDYPDGSYWETNKQDGEDWKNEQSGHYLYGKGGFDYYINNRNIISLTYQINDGVGKNSGLQKTRMYMPDENTPHISFSQGHNSKYNFGNQNWSLNYQHILDSAKQRQFFIDASWIKNYQKAEGGNEIFYYSGDFADVSLRDAYNLKQPLESNIFSIQSDLEFPLDDAQKSKIDAGLKYSFVNNDNNQKYFIDNILNPNLSNHYIYSENIAAFYGMFNHTFSPKLSLEAGIRGEYTALEGNNKTIDSIHTNDYFGVFPTLNINTKFAKKSGVNFSYRYRLTRPNYTDLNPIIVRNSAYSYSVGNPYLNPEYSHSLRLRYLHNHVPIVTLSYERSDGDIRNITYYQGDTTVTQPQNIGKTSRIGLGLMWQQFFFDKWRLMLYFDGSYLWSEYKYNEKMEKTETYRGSVYVSNDITLTPTMSLDVNGWGMLPQKSLFATNAGLYSVNIGFKKSFFKKSLTASLSLNDIFNTANKWTNDAKYPTGQQSYSEYYWASRSISLRVSYRFGKGNIPMRQKKNAAEEEAGRMGGQGGQGGQGQGGQGGGVGM